MHCITCKKDLKTKYLGICERCRTITWSKKYLTKVLKAVCRENKIEYSGLESFVGQKILIEQAITKCINGLVEPISETFEIDMIRHQSAYAIKLDKTWSKKGIVYDYYVGGTGKHPAYRFLEHLLLYKNAPIERANSMKYIEEFIWKKGSNSTLNYKLEENLAKKYCNNGNFVYSDTHKCSKCRGLKK